MIGYILWALALYFVYISVHAVQNLSSSSKGGNLLTVGLGTRDDVAENSTGAKRCGRAQRNMEEALFFFLPLALLLIITEKDNGLALTGALVFVVARAIYLPVYMMGVYAVRTVVWAAGVAGLIMMIMRLTS